MQQTVRQYQDWLILISQTHQQWGFIACTQTGEPLTDHNTYSTAAQASVAAELFIDCVVSCSQLRGLMDDWLESGSISTDQYSQAENLLSTIAKAQTSHHSLAVQALTPPPPEIPPDPVL